MPQRKINKITDKNLYLLANPLNTENKITIDIKDVISYAFCAQHYEFYSEENVINFKQLYNNAIHEVFYSYLIALQNDVLENTIEFLKYNWGKKWIKYKTKKELLTFQIEQSSAKRDYYESKRKKGIDAIINFDDIMSKDRQCPIIINHKYEIEILPNIILTGTFEYIRELTIHNNKKIFQVVKFMSETNRYSTNVEAIYNLETIAMSYAFKNLFNVDYFQSVTIDIEKKKIFASICSDKDYDILKSTVKSAVIGILNDIKLVSPNKQCYHCEYRNKCSNIL